MANGSTSLSTPRGLPPEEAYEARAACAKLQRRIGPHCREHFLPESAVEGASGNLSSPTNLPQIGPVLVEPKRVGHSAELERKAAGT